MFELLLLKTPFLFRREAEIEVQTNIRSGRKESYAAQLPTTQSVEIAGSRLARRSGETQQESRLVHMGSGRATVRAVARKPTEKRCTSPTEETVPDAPVLFSSDNDPRNLSGRRRF